MKACLLLVSVSPGVWHLQRILSFVTDAFPAFAESWNSKAHFFFTLNDQSSFGAGSWPTDGLSLLPFLFISLLQFTGSVHHSRGSNHTGKNLPILWPSPLGDKYCSQISVLISSKVILSSYVWFRARTYS